MLESACKTLRISRDAGPEEVRRAYVRLVRRYPPEHFPAKFTVIDAAYRRLILDDDAVAVFFRQMETLESPLEFAGLLWGDLEELRAPDFDLNDLTPLIKAGERAAELDAMLADIGGTDIEWRDKK